MSHKVEVSADIINTTTLRFWVDKAEWDAMTETARMAMVYDAFVKASAFVSIDAYYAFCENRDNPVFVMSEEGATLPHDFVPLVYDPKE